MSLALIFFIVGSIFGSFMNVCIYRLPRGESIVFPGSHCPNCNKSIVWYHNIPLLGFILLGGRCKDCRTKISFRYFLVELLTGLIWGAMYLKFGFSWGLVMGIIFLSFLTVVFFTDIETGLIPDGITYPGIVLGLVFSFLDPGLFDAASRKNAFLLSISGVVVGGGILILSAILGQLIFRKESMGGGDVKLLAMIGAFLGAGKTLFVFFAAPFLALPVAIYAKWFKRAETIPYGPYLAIAGAVFFLYGKQILAYFYSY